VITGPVPSNVGGIVEVPEVCREDTKDADEGWAPETPTRLARAGRPAYQGELAVADVPSSMERSVRNIPGLRSRSFTDFRRGGRRGVFIAQACLKSRAPANYPRRGEASHGARVSGHLARAQVPMGSELAARASRRAGRGVRGA
jgi:hypothetical protein